MSEEKRKPRCHNCIFGGTQFKIGKLTYLHCESPMMKKHFEEDENPSPWDSLRVFSDKCINKTYEHQFKPAKNK